MVLTVLVSCSAQDKSNRSKIQDLSIDEVRQIEGKLSCLQQSISHTEALRELEFKRFRRLKPFADSSETARLSITTQKDYEIVYQLRKGYDLVLVFDRSHKLRNARMSGEKWEQEQKSAKKHKKIPNSSPCLRDLQNVAQVELD